MHDLQEGDHPVEQHVPALNVRQFVQQNEAQLARRIRRHEPRGQHQPRFEKTVERRTVDRSAFNQRQARAHP